VAGLQAWLHRPEIVQNQTNEQCQSCLYEGAKLRFKPRDKRNSTGDLNNDGKNQKKRNENHTVTRHVLTHGVKSENLLQTRADKIQAQ
jgi:hypothetical protein